MQESSETEIQILVRKLFRGAGLKAASFFFVRLLQIFRIIFFARLFQPADIGLASLAVSCITVVSIFANFGFPQSIIRGKEKSQDYFHTIFSLSMLLGSLIFVVIWICAPLFSLIFSQMLEPYIRALALMALIIPAKFPVNFWEKNLDFGHPSIFAIISEAFTFFTAILVQMIWNAGVWSLIIGNLSGFIFPTIYVWVFSRYKPKFHINRNYIKPLFNFGAPLMVQGLNGEAMSRGDNLMVGAYCGTEQLAFYNFAWQLPMLISSFTQSLDSMFFPVFAKIQDDKNSVRRLFNLANKLWSLTGSFLGFALFSFTEPIVLIMYGKTWDPVIPILKVMSLSFILRFCTGYAYDNLVLISGRTKYTMKWGIINTILIFTAGQFMIQKFGPIGGAWFWMIQAIVLIPLIRFPFIYQELGSLEFFHHIWQPFLSGLIACAVSIVLIQYSTYISINYFLFMFLRSFK
jgi:O-antigen/teichoic acid export membrane protein